MLYYTNLAVLNNRILISSTFILLIYLFSVYLRKMFPLDFLWFPPKTNSLIVC